VPINLEDKRRTDKLACQLCKMLNCTKYENNLKNWKYDYISCTQYHKCESDQQGLNTVFTSDDTVKSHMRWEDLSTLFSKF
jgi:hypothetical protein